jgi:hypothetical protein
MHSSSLFQQDFAELSHRQRPMEKLNVAQKLVEERPLTRFASFAPSLTKFKGERWIKFDPNGMNSIWSDAVRMLGTQENYIKTESDSAVDT